MIALLWPPLPLNTARELNKTRNKICIQIQNRKRRRNLQCVKNSLQANAVQKYCQLKFLILIKQEFFVLQFYVISIIYMCAYYLQKLGALNQSAKQTIEKKGRNEEREEDRLKGGGTENKNQQ
ncbi:hypothetical protein ABPG72_007462 [Tetrahymena utriculariae]